MSQTIWGCLLAGYKYVPEIAATDLQVHLWDLDGVGCWALGACDGEGGGAAHGVCNMVGVVRAVEVLAIPATFKLYTLLALPLGKLP